MIPEEKQSIATWVREAIATNGDMGYRNQKYSVFLSALEKGQR